MATEKKSDMSREVARHRLEEAEAEFKPLGLRTTSPGGFVIHRLSRRIAAGLSSGEISELVGDIGQPNVVRARRQAITVEMSCRTGSCRQPTLGDFRA